MRLLEYIAVLALVPLFFSALSGCGGGTRNGRLASLEDETHSFAIKGEYGRSDSVATILLKQSREADNPEYEAIAPVSYTHLTLPTT